ncbi:MAG: hypothetical protein ACK4K9_00755 [Bacteroidia bacterium]
MQKFFFILIACLCWFQAKSQHENEQFNPEVKRFTFQPKTKIVIKKYDEGFDHDLAEGENTVFSYFYRAKDYVHIADDEYMEYFRFELKNPKRKFTLKDNELANANFIFNRGCFCPETGNYLIKKGTITAKRKGRNAYQIHVKFLVEPRDPSGMMMPVEKEIKGLFKKGKINLD